MSYACPPGQTLVDKWVPELQRSLGISVSLSGTAWPDSGHGQFSKCRKRVQRQGRRNKAMTAPVPCSLPLASPDVQSAGQDADKNNGSL